MSPQFVDFDADGHLDILAGTYDGSAHLARGSAAGWLPPQWLLDRQGARLVINDYWDTAAKQWGKTDRCDPPGPTGSPGHLTSAVAWDLDGDGDLDLLLGDHKSDRVFVRRNHGEPKAAALDERNELLLAAGAPLLVPGTVATLRVVDVDRDGRRDLLAFGMGDAFGLGPGGGAYWFRDEGREAAVQLGERRELLAPGTKDAGGPARPDAGLYGDLADFDGDGQLDLVVGGYAQWQPPKPVLSADQQARQAEVEREIAAAAEASAALNRALYAATEGMERAAAEQRRKELLAGQREARAALSTRRAALDAELERLAPRPRREAGIWLYRGVAR